MNSAVCAGAVDGCGWQKDSAAGTDVIDDH